MYQGKFVFSQIMSYLPKYEFNKCVSRYRGNYKVKNFSCWNQLLCMTFAQLTFRESLREIVTCLRAMQNKLYHIGFRSNISKSTLADANEKRDWRIYADFAQVLIYNARQLYSDDDFITNLDEAVYALDSSTIDLCLSLFPWAYFRKRKGAIKLHTLLDLRGNIPSFIKITDGKIHDVNILDELISEPGSFYIMDRGYLDFSRLYIFQQFNSFFVLRAKINFQFRRLYSHQVDKTTGLICDQTIVLKGFYPSKDYPDKLPRMKFYDIENDKTFVFLTNNFNLPALTIAELYKCRWQIELFFKWIKQHLKIKSFYGTSENAVKTQIWIAITIYLLVTIVKKQVRISLPIYTLLQILSVSVFEQVHILQLVRNQFYKNEKTRSCKQLNLYDL